MVRGESKNKPKKYASKRDWITRSKLVNYTRLNSQHHWGEGGGVDVQKGALSLREKLTIDMLLSSNSLFHPLLSYGNSPQ